MALAEEALQPCIVPSPSPSSRPSRELSQGLPPSGRPSSSSLQGMAKSVMEEWGVGRGPACGRSLSMPTLTATVAEEQPRPPEPSHQPPPPPGRFRELLLELAATHESQLSALRAENEMLRKQLAREGVLHCAADSVQKLTLAEREVPMPPPMQPAFLELPKSLPTLQSIGGVTALSDEESSIGEPAAGRSAIRRRVTRHVSAPKNFKTLSIWRTEAETTFKRKVSLCRTRSSVGIARVRNREAELTISGSGLLQLFVVHPSSTKRLVWDLLSMTLLAYDIVVIPFVGAFNPAGNTFMAIMNWFTMLFWTFDMLASFLTGYQDGRHTVIVPERICLRYMRTWLILDLLIVGLDWSLVLLGNSDGSGSAARLGRSLRTLRFVRTLRLIRLLKVKRILQEIQDQINTEALSICFNIAKIILVLVMANHIVACCWYGIGQLAHEDVGYSSWVVENNMERRTLTYQYFTSLHWSLTQFTPASMEVVPFNVHERIFAVIVLLFAMITFSSFVSILTASMAELRNISSDETRQFWLLRRYLRDWNVSRRSSIRIQRYLEYAYQRQRQRVQAKDVKLLMLLSGALSDDLKFETLATYLSAHPFFVHIDGTMRVFSKALSESSLARGDWVFSCGEQASSMTFLSSGSLQYQLGELENEEEGQEEGCPDVVLEGQWICEPVLWAPWLHLGDLLALTESQAVTIDAQKFGEAVQVNKPVWLGVRKYAEQFVKLLNTIEREDLTDLMHTVMSAQEIIDESGLQKMTARDVEEEEDSGALTKLRRVLWGRRSRISFLSSATVESLSP